MTIHFFRRAALTAALLSPFVTHAAAVIDLNNVGYFTYGNVNSYSLPLAGIDVKSGPGQIKDYVVIYTGADGQPARTNDTGFDNAYLAPSGTLGYASINGAVNVTNPGNKSGIANNNANTWDANLLAMKGFLDGGLATFMFNNNDTNEDQNLAIWAKFWITDGSNNVYNNRYLYLSNEGAAYGAGGQPNGDATDYDPGNITNPTTGFQSTDYVLSGGNVFGVNHNLGADRVAYAAMLPLLNDWFDTLFALDDAALSNYTFHFDMRLGCVSATAWGTCDNVKIDNGYEQLFLVSSERPRTDVPEPGVISLLAAALGGLYMMRRKI